MKNKIILFIPNSRWFNKRAWPMINHGGLIISGILKDKYDFSILDANGKDMSEDECFDYLRLLDPPPTIVMIPTVSVEYHLQNHLAAKIAKRACGATTIMGGVYVTTMTEEVMKDVNIDYGFIGHAEERLDKFIEMIIGGREGEVSGFDGVAFRDSCGNVSVNALKSTIANIKLLVDPDYSLMDLTPYVDIRIKKDFQFTFGGKKWATIITSYGCPYNCNFCATRTITGRHIKFRSPDSVINEIKYLKNNYGIQAITFLDDCLLFDRARIEEILERMIACRLNINFKLLNASLWHIDQKLLNLLKRAGCLQVSISVESGSERVLKDIIHKPLRKEHVPLVIKWAKAEGIYISSSWIIGFPGETWEEIRETFRFAEEIDSDYSVFHIATLLPKTDLFHQTKEAGLLPHDFSFLDDKYFGFGESFIETDEFTSFELKTLRAFEWDRINFSSREKTEKIAKMFDITLDELNEHRKLTRKKLGIHL